MNESETAASSATPCIRIQIQANVPYEQSLLWTLHRDYYQQQGLDAFLRQEVPYNISSNPCLAAQTLRLLQATQPDQTLHVLEIGAGLGIFAYNFLQELTTRTPERELCYWLSDYSLPGLRQLAAQPAFAAWIASGRLRLCLIDGENPQQAWDLDGQVLPLPTDGFALIVANYVFSTLPTAVLLRQQGQWLRQLTRLEWLPLGEAPDPAELSAFGGMLATRLRQYRLVDHLDPTQASYPMFQALQAAQDQVADQLTGLTPGSDPDAFQQDFGDWLAGQLSSAWAGFLQTDPVQALQDNVEQLLIVPLLRNSQPPPEQIHESHSFAPVSSTGLFADESHLQAIAALTADWPLMSLGYSAPGLAALEGLLELTRPQGLILLNDKAYADSSWMQGLQPEHATRHGQSLAHPVNFPLFAAVMTQKGLVCRATTDPAQALHSLLICKDSAWPPAVAERFQSDFVDYPRNEISHALLEGGHALMQAERLEQAERCLQRALSYRPGDATLQYLTAVCLLNQERYPEALALLKRPHDDLFGLFNREILQAEIYRLTGQPEQALPCYQASLRHGENSQTYYNLALCQLELGQEQAARVSLERARELDPADPEIQALLDS